MATDVQNPHTSEAEFLQHFFVRNYPYVFNYNEECNLQSYIANDNYSHLNTHNYSLILN